MGPACAAGERRTKRGKDAGRLNSRRLFSRLRTPPRAVCPPPPDVRGGPIRGLLKAADAVWGPVGGKGLTDDPVLGDGSPEAAVVACPTVVAHHEVMVGRDRDRPRLVAGFGAAAGDDERLVALFDPVDDR